MLVVVTITKLMASNTTTTQPTESEDKVFKSVFQEEGIVRGTVSSLGNVFVQNITYIGRVAF